jgi:hypothetical protein
MCRTIMNDKILILWEISVVAYFHILNRFFVEVVIRICDLMDI